MNKPPPPLKRTILLVDDEEDLREVLTDALNTSGFQVIEAANGADALARVRDSRPDIVILDLMLPDLSGFAVCKKIKEQAAGHLPVILLTARADMDSLVEGLEKASADDYVVKPFRNRELLARIGACLRVKDLHDLVQRQNEFLADLSVTDDLTGLHNRRYLTRKLDEHIVQLRGSGGSLSCVLMDLDHFKEVNDAQGHLAGDEVLRKFGQLLKRSLADSANPAICGRWGGDEFLVMFSSKAAGSDDPRVREWSRNLISRLEKESLNQLSGGIATVQGPDKNLDPVRLIADLDALLYQAKKDGRNRFVFAKFDSIGRAAAPARRKKDAEQKPVVFVLEDEPDICAIIRDMLSRQNVTQRIFQETKEMWTALETTVPDLILLDLKLSDGDGMEVCRQLRKKKALADTRISFLTAFTSDEIKQKAMACGADAFLLKPFTYSRFTQEVNKLLGIS